MQALAEGSVAGYLLDRGVVTSPAGLTVTELTGGVSCAVFRVDGPMGAVVVKQALPRLRVAAQWLADPDRAGIEALAMSLLGSLTPASVPRLLDEDRANHTLTMTGAPRDWITWKQQLLAGHVEPAAPTRLGELLATWHTATTDTSGLAGRFHDPTGFHQLRIAPFLETAAGRHPEQAAAFAALVERLLSRRLCLVHGDFTPKNVLVGDVGLWVLDFEIAHVGDPAFDVALLLTHLLLKTAHLPGHAAAFAACAGAFVDSYTGAVTAALLPDDAHLLALIGGLLVARVDGKSPAGYLTPPAQQLVRATGLQLLRGELTSLAESFAEVSR